MRVHRNLNKACWSLTVRGERVQHCEAFALSGVRFVVSAAGHKRVTAKRVRMVHAWADGEPCEVPASVAGLVGVTYNPFRCDRFIRVDTGEVVESAALVVFWTDGRCYARLN